MKKILLIIVLIVAIAIFMYWLLTSPAPNDHCVNRLGQMIRTDCGGWA